MKNKKIKQKTDQADLNDHGVQDIIPKDEEYYTLNLNRGNDTDSDDIPDIDFAGVDPASENQDEPLTTSSLYEGQAITKNKTMPTSSDDGGAVSEEDTFNENTASGKPAGTAGHWGDDE